MNIKTTLEINAARRESAMQYFIPEEKMKIPIYLFPHRHLTLNFAVAD